jgi:hypothetical protein
MTQVDRAGQKGLYRPTYKPEGVSGGRGGPSKDQIGGASKFEPVPFDQVAGGPGNANAGHGGHGTNSGAVDAGFAKASRGMREVNFAAVRGHGVAKRSPGKSTPKGVDGGRLE